MLSCLAATPPSRTVPSASTRPLCQPPASPHPFYRPLLRPSSVVCYAPRPKAHRPSRADSFRELTTSEVFRLLHHLKLGLTAIKHIDNDLSRQLLPEAYKAVHVRTLRKHVARLMTIKRERELEIQHKRATAVRSQR